MLTKTIVKWEYINACYQEVDFLRLLYTCVMFDENSFNDAAYMLKL